MQLLITVIIILSKMRNDSDMLNNFIEKTGEDICRKL